MNTALPPPFAAPQPANGPLIPPAAPGGVNGIPGAMGAAAPPPAMQLPPDPASMKYTNETQQDGSILIRVMNPDGTPGPVVKIVPPPMKAGGKK